ncbi:DUF739 family protein [Salinicoccus albus]|uniref:DUF739 family protein n=1 Tax=Salinicoccus albus TaxID=418756 RepID=UPI0003769B35|nr:DUF739 family protein [Salinicoccus albus]
MAEEFNYDLLLQRMDDYRYNQSRLAKDMPISRTSMSAKINNHNAFTQWEIRRICTLLEIPDKEVGKYFFNKNVRKTV